MAINPCFHTYALDSIVQTSAFHARQGPKERLICDILRMVVLRGCEIVVVGELHAHVFPGQRRNVPK